ncbi:hypothetical protein JCM18909_2291 [Cutibacterium acnes JCM 18909]|nr:hypothetical protein JCM18909_2291 [Cutibacterium acnes JCM 18909]
MGKKVTIKAGSLDEVDKRVAQALGNKSGSLKITPRTGEAERPEQWDNSVIRDPAVLD